MDWLQFTSSLIGSLAWPIVVLALAFLFRFEFKAILKVLKSAKVAGLELQVQRELQVLSADTAKIAAPAPPDVSVGTGQGSSPFTADALKQYWSDTRDERPAAVITESWNKVYTALRQLFDGISENKELGPIDPSELIFRLKQVNYIDEELMGVLMRLLSVRNTVAHVPNFEPSEAQGLEYRDSATKVAYALETTLSRFWENQQRE